MELQVQLASESYPITIEEGAITRVASLVGAVCKGPRVVIITDTNVKSYYGACVERSFQEAGYEVTVLTLPAGEKTKSMDMLPDIYASLVNAGITRQDTIIALGGGVIGDLAGFVAATYLRGIALVQIPTSLLAQVDSSVGGKVAVDLPSGKNLVGAFYHPKWVVIDPDTLDTLPHRYLVDGMGEVIKYGCIVDAGLFDDLSVYGGYAGFREHRTEVIARCCDAKRQIVEADAWDRGERMKLNFGHTLGHAIEQYYQYGRYSHGEAVAMGMQMMTDWSEAQGLTEKGTAARLRALLTEYELPTSAPVSVTALAPAMGRDKKQLGHVLHIILLRCIGESYIHPTTVAELEESMHG